MLTAQHTNCDKSIPLKSDLEALTNTLLTLFQYDSLSKSQSRKSCKCGCEILREKYLNRDPIYYITIDDFCDSFVFTWKTNSMPDENELINIINNVYPFIGGQNKKEKKFRRYSEFIFEDDNILAFLKIKKYSKGIDEITLSLPYNVPQ